MTKSLKVVSEEHAIETGVSNPERVAEGLADALADTYCLTFKTHSYHWNVEGQLFFAIHNLTEGQYEDMFAAADVLAERIRALGQLAPMSLNDIVKRANVKDKDGPLSAGEMCEDLAKDHEAVAKRLHDLVEIAGEASDVVTEDLATARSAFHEKAAWMLRATVAQ